MICTDCKNDLDEEAFAPCFRREKLRRARLCRSCSKIRCASYAVRSAAKIAARKRAQRETTKPAQQAYARAYYAKNADTRNRRSSEWHAKNRESVYERHAKWARDNPGLAAERVRRRDATKLMATPAWADIDKIKAIYSEAARLTIETGVPHEVDHFYPLQSNIGCGLHVEANLRIISKTENAAKSNKWPE